MAEQAGPGEIANAASANVNPISFAGMRALLAAMKFARRREPVKRAAAAIPKARQAPLPLLRERGWGKGSFRRHPGRIRAKAAR